MRANLAIAFLAIFLVGFPSGDAIAQNRNKFRVFQDLDEATSRIPRVENKPFMTLFQAHGGFFQPEVIIFKDIETGNEVWSLSREACTEIANIERRSAWSCNGQFISFIGNTAFLNYTNNQLWKRSWNGYNYVGNADGSGKRKLWAKADGKLRMFQDKFNNWDAKRPNILYYCGTKDESNLLWRVTLRPGMKDSTAEIIYRFPTKLYKVIQEISDENFMVVEERGDKPNCYVINLNRDPKHPKFCLTYPLKGMVHPGSFRFARSIRYLTGGYEWRKGLTGSINLRFDENSLWAEKTKRHITKDRRMGHLWYGPPDDRVGFFGKYKGKMGLWLQMPGKVPVLMADTTDGHVSWCGHDPEWFFGAVGTGVSPQKEYNRRLLACNADGKTVKIICTPFDRRRPGKPNYASIPRPNQSPDATKCWFHSSMLLPDDKYTGSYIAVFRRPYAPVTIEMMPGTKGVTISWKPHVLSYETKGYHVYRSSDGGKTWAELTDGAISAKQFVDKTKLSTATNIYAVTSEEWSRLESDMTSPTLTVGAGVVKIGKPVTRWDKTAPKAVTAFRATKRKDGLISITWKANTDTDLRYYNIYASSAGEPAVEQKRLLVSPPRGETLYIDWTAPKRTKMHYAITAVDRQGNESSPVFALVK